MGLPVPKLGKEELSLLLHESISSVTEQVEEFEGISNTYQQRILRILSGAKKSLFNKLPRARGKKIKMTSSFRRGLAETADFTIEQLGTFEKQDDVQPIVRMIKREVRSLCSIIDEMHERQCSLNAVIIPFPAFSKRITGYKNRLHSDISYSRFSSVEKQGAREIADSFEVRLLSLFTESGRYISPSLEFRESLRTIFQETETLFLDSEMDHFASIITESYADLIALFSLEEL